ncbi:MAG: hypothetical protein ACKV0T_26235 [Planctomycetales bacterium]
MKLEQRHNLVAVQVFDCVVEPSLIESDGLPWSNGVCCSGRPGKIMKLGKHTRLVFGWAMECLDDKSPQPQLASFVIPNGLQSGVDHPNEFVQFQSHEPDSGKCHWTPVVSELFDVQFALVGTQ